MGATRQSLERHAGLPGVGGLAHHPAVVHPNDRICSQNDGLCHSAEGFAAGMGLAARQSRH